MSEDSGGRQAMPLETADGAQIKLSTSNEEHRFKRQGIVRPISQICPIAAIYPERQVYKEKNRRRLYSILRPTKHHFSPSSHCRNLQNLTNPYPIR